MRYLLAVVWLCALQASAYTQVQVPLSELPQDQAYQRTLRAYLLSLTVADFAVKVKPIVAVDEGDLEPLYRLWLLSLQTPNLRAVTLPPESFTLAAIEGEKGLRLPIAVNQCQTLAWLASWDYEGNSYAKSAAVKRRALALAAIDMMLLDYLYDHNPRGANRSDYLGGNLIWVGYTYWRCRDVLPADARAAFEVGLRRLVEERLVKWGPKGHMTDMDLFAPVGLWYTSRGIDDPDFTAVCRAYSKPLFTEPRYFHEAGYFVDNGCFDTSYNGISLYFGTWAALATDWDFADEAMDRALRLRAHLCFPAPDGSFSGPSGMSSRTSADPSRDQWQFAERLPAEGMVSQHALYRSPPPTVEAMQAAHAKLIARLNKPLAMQTKPADAPWKESHWSHLIPFAAEHCPPDRYATLLKLNTDSPELFKPLYGRPITEPDGWWSRDFGRAFVITHHPDWAAAIHMGPVGIPAGHNGLWYGSGGGQLATYWTPKTGVLIVNRRRGVQGGKNRIDRYDEWRSWPVHAVIGETKDGRLLTSGRIRQPSIGALITEYPVVSQYRLGGEIPVYSRNRRRTTSSGLDYRRGYSPQTTAFDTTVTPRDNAPALASLYESIPVLIRDTPNQKPTRIDYTLGETWEAFGDDPIDGVTAIRLQRFDGAAVIRFKTPRRVQLSPLWTDGYQTKAQLRTLLIDIFQTRTVSWSIAPTAPDQPPE